MLIAVMADRTGPDGAVPPRYEDSALLLIVETDDGRIVAQYPRVDDQGLGFGERINAHGCEAVVCGTMQKPGFEAVAATGVTRYHGTGLDVHTAAQMAVDSALPLITDFEGGTGCGSHGKGDCRDHDHH